MQTVPAIFNQNAVAGIRKPAYQLRMSFDKAFDPGLLFFELDTSLLNGTDVLAPSDNNVVQEWDKYIYLDYTDRLMQMEWTREEDMPYSVNLAMADIVLNNYDSYFTRGSSPLDPNILPKRPIRLLSGFSSITIPQFVGLTESVPKVDKSSRTASIHCIDFLSFLFNKPLNEAVMLENKRTDEVLDYLFQLFGLSPSQYVLDQGFNTIQFVYFPPDMLFGEAARQLMQAELGSLFMDELGTIRFRNRGKEPGAAVWSFDDTNIIDYRLSDETKIINVVTIKADVREVQPMDEVYSSTEVIELSTGTTERFFNFSDPVTSIDPITAYVANTQPDGSGSNVSAFVSISDTDLFATSVKVTFNNTSGAKAYLTSISIDGTAATIVGEINERFQDDASVEEFEELPITINNNFIQDYDGAARLALSILNYFGGYGNSIELDVKGTPALQLGDTIQVDVDDISGAYTISKITNILETAGRYTQRLVGKVFDIPAYFILSSDSTAMSLLDGTDVLAP